MARWLTDDCGASLSAKDNDGRDALHYAATGGHAQLCAWLQSLGAAFEDGATRPVHMLAAAKLGVVAADLGASARVLRTATA